MKIQFRKLYLLVIISTIVAISGCDNSGGAGSSDNNVSGKSGSMARFQVVDQYLYTITNSVNMTLFDITDPSTPTRWLSVDMPRGIETLHQYNNYLFVGANRGVNIFDNTIPGAPVFVSSFAHIQSCDPVVVSGDYAYATLRSGTNCRFGANQLDVIDISNIDTPELVNTYSMNNPRGLGIDGSMLFVCDNDQLITFDITEPLNLKVLDSVNSDVCFDVIPDLGKLLVSNASGLSQYNYNSLPLNTISNIPLSR